MKNILCNLFKIYRHSNKLLAVLIGGITVLEAECQTNSSSNCSTMFAIDQGDVYQFTYKCNPFDFTSIPEHLLDLRLGMLCSNSRQDYLIN